MRTAGRKDVLTTGEVARISRDRRIPLQQLIAFMRAHGIPLDGLDQGCCRLMVLSDSFPRDMMEAINASDRYELRVAANGFEAGMVAQEFRPHVVVVDLRDEEDQEAVAVCRLIKNATELQAAKVLAVTSNLSEGREGWLLLEGFDGCLAKPLTTRGLLEAVEEATNLIS
jgi:CheY-like chemotaxis protein